MSLNNKLSYNTSFLNCDQVIIDGDIGSNPGDVWCNPGPVIPFKVIVLLLVHFMEQHYSTTKYMTNVKA